jgi:aspartyl aminopeptidase
MTNEYIEALSENKTEREWVDFAERKAVAAGFKSFEANRKYKPGDKVYFINRRKNFAAFIVGKNPEYNILGAHIDSPRIDIKQAALTDKDDVAYFDTHYYGGIKKYQWVTIPLALHGVVCKPNGTTININIGDKPGDPVFCITDLLPHLDYKRMSSKKAEDFVNGENMDVIAAVADKGDKEVYKKNEEKSAVKEKLLSILKDKYDIEEDDFYSSEFELVPAGKASYCGLDMSLVAGYGQDDRVCAFTSLMAILDTKDIPDNTACTVLVDKEEIGSYSATGAESIWFETCLKKMFNQREDRNTIDMDFYDVISKSNMLSSDVTAAFDPLYADAYSKHTSAKLGYGMMLSKYNGCYGKSGSNDAMPEYIAKLRNLFKNELYQFDEMGKVDMGGGGTIASIYCRFNMNVIDAGVPVLNMHSPMELTHVDDILSAFRCYRKFLTLR